MLRYLMKAKEIARTSADGTTDVAVHDLRNRAFYVGGKDQVSRMSIPLETLIRDDSFDTYRMGADFTWTVFCRQTSVYNKRAGKKEGNP